MNRLLTLKEVVTRMIDDDVNRICDEHGVPEKDRAKVAAAALSPLLQSPSPRVPDHA